MTPKLPYLFRAIYQWIEDNKQYPCILFDTQQFGVEIPDQFSGQAELVLNVSSESVRCLTIDQKVLRFQASFSGKIAHIVIPVHALLALYPEDNPQEGIAFSSDGRSIDDAESVDDEHEELQAELNNNIISFPRPRNEEDR